MAIYKTLSQSTMPGEDLRYWQDTQIGLAVASAYKKYDDARNSDTTAMDLELKTTLVKGLSAQESKEAVDVTRSPRRDDVEFAMTQSAPIRQELQTEFGWTSAETTALNGARVMTSYLGKATKNQQKARDAKHEKYKQTYQNYKAKHTQFRDKKAVPYKSPAYRGTDQY